MIVREERIGGQREVLIYALTYPGTDRVRYIGKTVRSPRKRHNEHIAAAMKDKPRLPVHRWIKSLYRRGMWSCLWHLERVPESEDWATRERHWIEKFRSEGHNLLNLTDGGEGLSGLPRSQETRDKISAGNKTGSFFDCKTCGSQFWRKLKDIKLGNCKFCSRACYQKSLIGVSKPVSRKCIEASIAAIKVRAENRTHCARGHHYSEENTYVNPRGARVCKQCRKVNKNAYLARNK